MAGNGAIFRVTTTGDTESSVGSAEKIEFDGGIVPDSSGRMVNNRFNLSRDFSEHPSPKKPINQIKDGKLGSYQIIIAGVITMPGTAQSSANLVNWMTNDATNDDFLKGRFGFRNDTFPIFDLTPSLNIGYILVDVEFQEDREFQGKVEFIATLRRNGSI